MTIITIVIIQNLKTTTIINARVTAATYRKAGRFRRLLANQKFLVAVELHGIVTTCDNFKCI